MIRMMVESLLVVLVYMTLLFLVAMMKKNNSLVDIAWGPGFVLLVLYNLLRTGPPSLFGVTILVMTGAWGIRLAVHVGIRNAGKKEDFRYAKWRREWGRFFVSRSYLQIFVLQGFLMTIIGIPIIFILQQPARKWHWLDFLGILIWLGGFLWEVIADWQLASFIRHRKSRSGEIMTGGLWRYSRHPNYFGEALLWWGPAILCLPWPGGWVTLLSPLCIDFLLLRVSGVPMLEKKYRKNPAWESYARRTNKLIPGIPRKN
jgi:steroid 5-alpha reductase family enzyme